MKKRLDLLLVERGLAESRTRAQALVLEGKVRVGGQVETKASRTLDETAEIAVEAPPRFVSRGGEKLEGAFVLWGDEGRGKKEEERGAETEETPLSALGKICLDVGSSTGGFTDCLLQHGAARVMAVDVGTNQLAYKLRADPRVWVKENFNARYMTSDDLPEVPEIAVTDVSFISLRLILPPISDVLAPGGLVRDEALRLEARDGIVRFATDDLGLTLLGLAESPIRGKEMGNIEYLSYWEKTK